MLNAGGFNFLSFGHSVLAPYFGSPRSKIQWWTLSLITDALTMFVIVWFVSRFIWL